MKAKEATKQKNNDQVMFHKFFAEFYKWNAVIFTLFLVSYICAIIWGGEWGKYWIIPIGFMVILLIAIRYYVLFFTAYVDYKKLRIKAKDISIQAILRDKRLSFTNRGGGIAGKGKYRIIDSEGTIFHITDVGNDLLLRPDDYYHGAKIKIEYLERSKVVLHMKNVSQNVAAQHLYDDFQPYFQRISKN